MTDTAPAPATAPSTDKPRRWLVTLSRPTALFGEMLSPSHPHIEVDDNGLALLGGAVSSKTEIVEG